MQIVDLGPDGKLQFPDDATPDEIQAEVNRLDIQKLRGEDKFSKWLAVQNQSPGGVKNALAQITQKGVGSLLEGAQGLAQAMEPAAAMGGPELPDVTHADEVEQALKRSPSEKMQLIQEGPAYQFGRSLKQRAEQDYPIPSRERQSLVTSLAEAAGSFVPLIASGPLAPVTIGLQSAGEHIENDYEAAKHAGMSDDEAASTAFNRAIASGGLQATIFAVLPKPLRTLGDKYLIDKFGKDAITRFLTGRAAQFGEGATLGAASRISENALAGQPLFEGVAESAGGLGAIQALMPRGLTKKEAEEREVFFDGWTPQTIAPKDKALLQTFGAGFAPKAETEMVRTSRDVMEPHLPPYIPLEERPGFVPPVAAETASEAVKKPAAPDTKGPADNAVTARIEQEGDQSKRGGVTQRQDVPADAAEVRQGEGGPASGGNRLKQGGQEQPQPDQAGLPQQVADKPTAADLYPALLLPNGRTVSGGDSHAEVLRRNMGTSETPELLVQAFSNDAAHIFLDRKGNRYSRRQAADALGEKEPLN